MAARRRRRLRAQPLIHLVPNIFTVMSLCAGLTAIRYGLDQRFELALMLIVVAGVFDGLDGRSARLLKITSKLGAQLDSLADFLSFGVAPALLVYLWSLNQVKGVGWALALLFATCCALRLARFNTELEEPDHTGWRSRFFTGLPAPSAAGCLIIPMLASFALDQSWPRSWYLNAVVSAATSRPTPIRVGSTHSGLTRTTIILIEKVGTRLTISSATTTVTSALRYQLCGQVWPRAKVASIGMIRQPAAEGAGRPVKNRLRQLG